MMWPLELCSDWTYEHIMVDIAFHDYHAEKYHSLYTPGHWPSEMSC